MHGAKPWGLAFIEMVKKGPVDKEVALATLSGLVPPGQAWRTYARTRISIAERRGRPTPELVPNEDGVRSGARQIVMQGIVSMKSRGRIRSEEDAWGRVTYHYVRDAMPQPKGEKARERVMKGIETSKQRYGEGFFSERAKKGALSRTPEERSESGRKGWRTKTPEQRAEIIKKGLDAFPIEERSKRITEGWAKKSPEEKRLIGKRRWEGIDEEERQRRAMKGVETRRRRAWFRKGPERKNESVSNRPEGRDEQDQHGGEGRAAPHHEGAVG